MQVLNIWMLPKGKYGMNCLPVSAALWKKIV